MAKESFYVAQINGELQVEVTAVDIYEAFTKALAEYKAKYEQEEQPGYSISCRVWQAYGEGF